MTRLVYFLPALALAGMLAACGGDGSPGQDNNGGAGDNAPPADQNANNANDNASAPGDGADADANGNDNFADVPTPQSCADQQTIADILSNDDRFSTFVEALQQTGWYETLDLEGFYTVFAPTNDAFPAPGGGDFEFWFDDSNRQRLVVEYHIMTETLASSDLAASAPLMTVSGQESRCRALS